MAISSAAPTLTLPCTLSIINRTSSSPKSLSLSSSNSFFFSNTLKPLTIAYGNRSYVLNGKKKGLSCTCLFGLGVPELAVIAGVVALVFGPKKLPEVGRSIGKTVKSFQQSLTIHSAATSRTVRSRVTVGVAPTFKSAQRAAQRKEFYTKLEEKHQALKAEKMEYEARTKEEQEEAIKQMRKSMVVKANPVPNFYRQGPPPKAELKKLPLTRAKSPKLTRRKSCGDTTHPVVDEKAVCSRVRHSLGTYKPAGGAPSPVKPSQGRTINRTAKPVNEPPKASPRKLAKESSSDIAVRS